MRQSANVRGLKARSRLMAGSSSVGMIRFSTRNEANATGWARCPCSYSHAPNAFSAFSHVLQDTGLTPRSRNRTMKVWSRGLVSGHASPSPCVDFNAFHADSYHSRVLGVTFL